MNGIPSKRFDVWSRLYNRYSLEPHPAIGSLAAVALTVQPITDADRLLRRGDIDVSLFAVVAQATVTVRTVPAGERWTLYAIEAGVASGTYTHNQFSIGDLDNESIAISDYTATGTSENYQLPVPLVLDELWTVRVNINDFTGAGNLQTKLLIDIEDAY